MLQVVFTQLSKLSIALNEKKKKSIYSVFRFNKNVFASLSYSIPPPPTKTAIYLVKILTLKLLYKLKKQKSWQRLVGCKMKDDHSPALIQHDEVLSPNVIFFVHWRQMMPAIWFLEIINYLWASIQKPPSFVFARCPTLFDAIISSSVLSFLETLTTLIVLYWPKLSQSPLDKTISPHIHGPSDISGLTQKSFAQWLHIKPHWSLWASFLSLGGFGLVPLECGWQTLALKQLISFLKK